MRLAIICRGKSLKDTWNLSRINEYDSILAINGASDYIPDEFLDYWSAGDMFNRTSIKCAIVGR